MFNSDFSSERLADPTGFPIFQFGPSTPEGSLSGRLTTSGLKLEYHSYGKLKGKALLSWLDLWKALAATYDLRLLRRKLK